MAKPDILHATAVAVGARGLLITGASGSGKSTLALQLIALGATLVADDRVIVTPTAEGAVRLSAPTATKGLIEARGLGLLRTDVTSAYVAAVVTLDETETRRLPPAEVSFDPHHDRNQTTSRPIQYLATRSPCWFVLQTDTRSPERRCRFLQGLRAPLSRLCWSPT